MNVRGRTNGGRKGIFAAGLLVTTILAGGGFAWAEAAAGGNAPPLGLAPVVTQAGFGDLAAKVRPAVVNIAITGNLEASIGRARIRHPAANAELSPGVAVRRDVPPLRSQSGRHAGITHARFGLRIHR